MKKLDAYSIPEEIINSTLHIGGAYISLIFSTIICFDAIIKNLSLMNVFSLIVFCVAMTIMYTMSAAYHCIQYVPAKQILKKLDHSAIYAAIAGMCTPLCLILVVPKYPVLGYSLLGFQWTTVLAGIAFKFKTAGQYKGISTIMYIVLGWTMITVAKPIIDTCDAISLTYLLGGGVVYSLGAVFYVIKSVRYFHCIWHVFVLLASVLHFMFMFRVIDMMK